MLKFFLAIAMGPEGLSDLQPRGLHDWHIRILFAQLPERAVTSESIEAGDILECLGTMQRGSRLNKT